MTSIVHLSSNNLGYYIKLNSTRYGVYHLLNSTGYGVNHLLNLIRQSGKSEDVCFASHFNATNISNGSWCSRLWIQFGKVRAGGGQVVLHGMQT